MPEAATDIEFLDATVGMNIPKNFIPAIEKVLISRHFFSSNQAFKQYRLQAKISTLPGTLMFV